MASHAQIHEIGVFAGGNNYIGDVGPTNYIKPNEFAFGLLPILRGKSLQMMSIQTCQAENKEH
jgi:Domain of unknown function (DUF6089)